MNLDPSGPDPMNAAQARSRPGDLVPAESEPAKGTRTRTRQEYPDPPGHGPEKANAQERGSATVLAAGVTAALVLMAIGFTAVGQATAARHRAQGAADAAALAGATKVLIGEGEACAAARAMAEDASVEFVDCRVDGLEITVRVHATPSGLPAAFGPARATSRAGPVLTE
ncbi:Rv3654c family TadE-like protein [Glycomyces sp. NPDC046736]|uniref:Rv3654c family TadE-like protein n=1 Tax=Glycomyces sp. NPDC046736 TaxID=3155615 RepID=UPI0033E53B0C